MKLSFVIPVYNAAEYIGRCLDSLLAQDIDDFEIICINDGSKDNSMDILREYEKKYAGKFNIISQENQGIGPARNNAFKTVTGEYTWFIDNDDCIQPNCLKSVFKVIEKFDADITNVVHLKGYFTENPFKKNFDGTLTVKTMNQDCAMYFYEDAPWSKIYKTEFLRKNDLFFPNIFGEDTSITFNLYSKTNKIIKIEQPLYAWFERKESFSHAIFSKKHFETFPVLLDTLRKQSELCEPRLKVFYDYLILMKADVHLPVFRNAEVTGELSILRDECIRKSEKVLASLEQNVFYEIHLKELETIKAKENKVRTYYESSTSWKITKPVRNFVQTGKKIAKKLLGK